MKRRLFCDNDHIESSVKKCDCGTCVQLYWTSLRHPKIRRNK